MTDLTRPLLTIGSRGSRLALIQAEEVRRLLSRAHPELRPAGAVAVVAIRTSGDRVRDRPLADLGGKGLFARELDQALLDRRIDCAAHSMKDMETALPPGTLIACVPPRQDPRDVLLSAGGGGLDALPAGARFGTASVRRRAFLLRRRPDLQVVLFRGNVDTRLRKLAAGEADATLLAAAGLRRLGLIGPAAWLLSTEAMPPAVGQGAIAVQCRSGDDPRDARIRAWLAAIDDRDSHARVTAERAMLAVLDGSCHTPIAGLATALPGGRLHLRGHVCAPDGSAAVTAAATGMAVRAAELGARVGERLRAEAGGLLDDWR